MREGKPPAGSRRFQTGSGRKMQLGPIPDGVRPQNATWHTTNWVCVGLALSEKFLAHVCMRTHRKRSATVALEDRNCVPPLPGNRRALSLDCDHPEHGQPELNPCLCQPDEIAFCGLTPSDRRGHVVPALANSFRWRSPRLLLLYQPLGFRAARKPYLWPQSGQRRRVKPACKSPHWRNASMAAVASGAREGSLLA